MAGAILCLPQPENISTLCTCCSDEDMRYQTMEFYYSDWQMQGFLPFYQANVQSTEPLKQSTQETMNLLT